MASTVKLNDMQLILLATAHQRDDGSLLPPPDSLNEKRGGISRAVAALIKRGLAEEKEVTDPKRVWREEDDRKIGVIITDAGRAAIAAEEPGESADTPSAPGTESPENNAVPVLPEGDNSAIGETMRPGTKQALVLSLVSREGGASLDELVAATGWLPHTTRAALTGLRKRGHTVNRDKIDGASRYTASTAA